MALGRNISPGQGEKYYRKDDYYLEREGGEDHTLEWGGTLAREWGLSGKASTEDWKNALSGQFPKGVAIAGGTFKDPKTGERSRRAGTDFEFSAPKSVSIQALVQGDARLIAAHREAVAVAMEELEKHVGARRGHGGKDWETTGRALYGRVTHLTSREGDPHLHDHGVFLNVTKNRDGTFQAMTNDRMMHHQRLAQEVYHSELSVRLVKLGYGIEKGRFGEPQIRGVTREQIERFSGRGGQIEAYIKEKWGVDWSAMSRDERNANRFMHDEAWKRTRKAKSAHETSGLQGEWKERAKEMGAEKVSPGRETRAIPEKKRQFLAREVLAHAVAHHTERESAVPEGEILRTALAAGRGRIAFEDVKKAFDGAREEGELLRQGGDGPKQSLVTSREALEREKSILRNEKAGRGKVLPLLSPLEAECVLKEIEKRDGLTLNTEQKAAARMILGTGNRYVGINGSAGTGKTTMLKPAVETLKAAGYEVLGLGPQHSAVHALKEGGILRARTLQSWLADRTAGVELSPGTVVIVDEAGLASMKGVDAVLKRIEAAGARAVFVGDVKQYESVEAGPAFRALQRNGMETVHVTRMQRQDKAAPAVREAAKASVSDPVRALDLLNGHIAEIRNPAERVAALADEYLKSTEGTLVLTGTHEVRRAVNERVRMARGLSGTGRAFETFAAEDLTKAERRRLDTYREGQDLRFTKEYRSLGVVAGETARVLEVDRERGGLAAASGRTLSFSPRGLSGDGWEIGAVETVELSPGDRIRITGNSRKREGLTNGRQGTVTEVSEAGIRVRVDAGPEVALSRDPSRPLEVAHGYAQTGHSAQGLSASRVLLDLPSGSPTVNRRSFYTNLTRTKAEVRAFTDDREALFTAVARERDKTLARDALDSPERTARPTGRTDPRRVR